MIDYLAIGHVCRDTTPEGARLGGSVSFSALMAQAMGLRVAILTSAPDDPDGLLAPLHDLQLKIIPAREFTTFRNEYTAQGRVQTLLGHAERIRGEDVPQAWRGARIVHLAPVADEVDSHIVDVFDDALIGI